MKKRQIKDPSKDPRIKQSDKQQSVDFFSGEENWDRLITFSLFDLLIMGIYSQEIIRLFGESLYIPKSSDTEWESIYLPLKLSSESNSETFDKIKKFFEEKKILDSEKIKNLEVAQSEVEQNSNNAPKEDNVVFIQKFLQIQQDNFIQVIQNKCIKNINEIEKILDEASTSCNLLIKNIANDSISGNLIRKHLPNVLKILTIEEELIEGHWGIKIFSSSIKNLYEKLLPLKESLKQKTFNLIPTTLRLLSITDEKYHEAVFDSIDQKKEKIKLKIPNSKQEELKMEFSLYSLRKEYREDKKLSEPQINLYIKGIKELVQKTIKQDLHSHERIINSLILKSMYSPLIKKSIRAKENFEFDEAFVSDLLNVLIRFFSCKNTQSILDSKNFIERTDNSKDEISNSEFLFIFIMNLAFSVKTFSTNSLLKKHFYETIEYIGGKRTKELLELYISNVMPLPQFLNSLNKKYFSAKKGNDKIQEEIYTNLITGLISISKLFFGQKTISLNLCDELVQYLNKLPEMSHKIFNSYINALEYWKVENPDFSLNIDFFRDKDPIVALINMGTFIKKPFQSLPEVKSFSEILEKIIHSLNEKTPDWYVKVVLESSFFVNKILNIMNKESHRPFIDSLIKKYSFLIETIYSFKKGHKLYEPESLKKNIQAIGTQSEECLNNQKEESIQEPLLKDKLDENLALSQTSNEKIQKIQEKLSRYIECAISVKEREVIDPHSVQSFTYGEEKFIAGENLFFSERVSAQKNKNIYVALPNKIKPLVEEKNIADLISHGNYFDIITGSLAKLKILYKTDVRFWSSKALLLDGETVVYFIDRNGTHVEFNEAKKSYKPELIKFNGNVVRKTIAKEKISEEKYYTINHLMNENLNFYQEYKNLNTKLFGDNSYVEEEKMV